MLVLRIVSVVPQPGGAAAATGKHQTSFQAPAASGRILSDS